MNNSWLNSTGYNGNTKLRRINTSLGYTAEQVLEFNKCIDDPLYFCKYVKIRVQDNTELEEFTPYDYQKNTIKTIHDNRFVITKFPRQSGKSTSFVAYIVWSILFNDNYAVAVLAHVEKQAKEILKRIKTAYENLPKWMQQGSKRWNEKDIELENGSLVYVAATGPNSIRGNSPNFVLLDEFAHVPSNMASDFMGSVYPAISNSKTTKIAIVSTPKGLNTFHKMWQDANKQGDEWNGYVPLEIRWNDVPGRDEEFKRKAIAALTGGEAQWDQEFECIFTGSTNTLIRPSKLASMVSQRPIIERGSLRVYSAPRDLRRYVITVDVGEGLGADYSAFQVTDITEYPFQQVAVFQDNSVSVLEYPNIIYQVATSYNNAHVLIETNSVGGQVASILWDDYNYANLMRTDYTKFVGTTFSFTGNGMGLRQTKTTKKVGCQTLKQLLEDDKLILHDHETIFELSNFVSTAGTYKADVGFHDDLAMGLVLFGWLTTQKDFQSLTGDNYRKSLAPITAIDFTPPGIYNYDSLEDENKFIVDAGDIWYTVQ